MRNKVYVIKPSFQRFRVLLAEFLFSICLPIWGAIVKVAKLVPQAAVFVWERALHPIISFVWNSVFVRLWEFVLLPVGRGVQSLGHAIKRFVFVPLISLVQLIGRAIDDLLRWLVEGCIVPFFQYAKKQVIWLVLRIFLALWSAYEFVAERIIKPVWHRVLVPVGQFVYRVVVGTPRVAYSMYVRCHGAGMRVWTPLWNNVVVPFFSFLKTLALTSGRMLYRQGLLLWRNVLSPTWYLLYVVVWQNTWPLVVGSALVVVPWYFVWKFPVPEKLALSGQVFASLQISLLGFELIGNSYNIRFLKSALRGPYRFLMRKFVQVRPYLLQAFISGLGVFSICQSLFALVYPANYSFWHHMWALFVQTPSGVLLLVVIPLRTASSADVLVYSRLVAASFFWRLGLAALVHAWSLGLNVFLSPAGLAEAWFGLCSALYLPFLIVWRRDLVKQDLYFTLRILLLAQHLLFAFFFLSFAFSGGSALHVVFFALGAYYCVIAGLCLSAYPAPVIPRVLFLHLDFGIITLIERLAAGGGIMRRILLALKNFRFWVTHLQYLLWNGVFAPLGRSIKVTVVTVWRNPFLALLLSLSACVGIVLFYAFEMTLPKFLQPELIWLALLSVLSLIKSAGHAVVLWMLSFNYRAILAFGVDFALGRPGAFGRPHFALVVYVLGLVASRTARKLAANVFRKEMAVSARKSVITLMCIHRYYRKDMGRLGILHQDVIREIAKYLYSTRYEPAWIRTIEANKKEVKQ